MEYILLDFMARGSSAAQLVFDLAILNLLKRRNACMHTILRAEADAQERAQQVRTRVYKFAFKELRAWRKP